MRVRCTVVAVVVAVVALARTAEATERLIRRLDDVGHVTALIQDGRGVLWMGTANGLRRHDGRAWQEVATDVRGSIHRLVAHADGVLVGEEFDAVWLVRHDGSAQRLSDEDGRPLRGPVGIAVAPSGAAWIVDEHGVWSGSPGALRRVPVPEALVHEVPRLIAIAPDDRAYVATKLGLWRVERDGASERLTDAGIPAALRIDGGDVLHLGWGGALHRWRDDAFELVFDLDHATTRARRGISLARRGDTLWVSYDLVLVALRPDRAPEILPASADLPSGGPLLVDDEGTLWLGTMRGLRQLPEPETVAYAEIDGMPSAHGRFVALTDEGAWFSTWQGMGLVRRGADRAETVDLPGTVVREVLCTDGAGRLWGGARWQLFVRKAGVSHVVDWDTPEDIDVDFLDCVVDGAGRVWMGTDVGVFVVDRDAAMPVRVAARRAEQVAIDVRGRLWITRESEVCVGDDATTWSCAEVPTTAPISDLWAAPSGAVWLSSRPGGVMRIVADGDGAPRVTPLGAPGQRASGGVASLAWSPRGGVWVASSDGLIRVVEDVAAPAGWRVIERLGPWQGLVTGNVMHVAETADGDLWLASAAGLISVPASARPGPTSPPAVALIELGAAGGTRFADARIELPASHNVLALGFAVNSQRAPELVRYRMRSDGGAWSPPSTATELQLRDLPSGPRTIEVAASLDGETWGPPARVTVIVATPWFRRTWVWVVVALVIALALVALHRARVAMHVRLERQRLHLAMELHDEMGSGLGSIGVLAGVARNTVADSSFQREVATTIAATAAELGAALGDIVGSLRRGPETLDQLGRRLGERAAATFPSGVELVRLLDELPALPLSPAAARAVQLIGHEALHNAARHAHAGRIEIGLRAAGDGRWQLWIEDDGVGFETAPADTETGLGLASMRRRAQVIEAALAIGPGPRGRGTRVALTFRLDAIDRRTRDRAPRSERRWS